VVTDGNFKSVHDAAITAAPDAAGAFSVASTDTAGGYQTYGLTTNATTSGTITFTYAGLTRPLSIPYRVGLKMFTYGSGTAADPYLIPDAATMEVFRKFVNLGNSTPDSYFVIAAPKDPYHYVYPNYTGGITIDLAGNPDTKSWKGMTNTFSGKLDGTGSTITGLVIPEPTQRPTVWTAGLFYQLSETTEIKNLRIVGAEITGPKYVNSNKNENSAAGILSAYATGGTITGVSVSGTITGSRYAQVGGLIGRLTAEGAMTLQDSSADVTIIGTSGFGITNQYTGKGPDVWKYGAGQLIGKAEKGQGTTTDTLKITQCATYGSISIWPATGSFVGLCNLNKLNILCDNSLSLTALQKDETNQTGVFAPAAVGGMFGLARDLQNGQLKITNSYFAGETDVDPTLHLAGGWVGAATGDRDATVEDYTHLNVIDTAYIDGVFSYNQVNLLKKEGAKWSAFSAYSWPASGAGGENGYAFQPVGSSYAMTEPAGSEYQQSQMRKWGTSASGVWNFAEGIYPRLSWQKTSDPKTL
ncbi:MAG: hypothetical protein RR281_04120, partial [Pseudoflavonifractor sp.]